MNSKWLRILGVAAVVSLVASAAQATLINLDANGYFTPSTPNNLSNVGSFSGQAVLGSGSWTVTNVTGTGTKSFSSLKQADGTPTSVQVALTNISQGYAQPSPPAGYGQALMRDYLFLQHPTGGQITSTLTISGLNTMTGYVSGVTRFDIAIYSSARESTDASTWTLGGTTKTSGVSDVTSPTGFIEGNDYVLFSGIADSSGTITATWTKQGSHAFSTFNGIQILAVPEPSTVALLGVCAGLPLLGVFRRLQKRAWLVSASSGP